MRHAWEYMTGFVAEMVAMLQDDEAKSKANWWASRFPSNQSDYVDKVLTLFDDWNSGRTQLSWVRVACIALAAWLLEHNPELWNIDTERKG